MKHAVIIRKSKEINRTWLGSTTIAPGEEPIYFEIYDWEKKAWELLDYDDVAPAGEIALMGHPTQATSNYYDPEGWVHHRVWQREMTNLDEII